MICMASACYEDWRRLKGSEEDVVAYLDRIERALEAEPDNDDRSQGRR
jgi:hypothetical protein